MIGKVTSLIHQLHIKDDRTDVNNCRGMLNTTEVFNLWYKWQTDW